MKTVVLCAQCDKPERECTCDRYCCYCQGLEGIRFCDDGKYYCPDCREACDIRVADPNERCIHTRAIPLGSRSPPDQRRTERRALSGLARGSRRGELRECCHCLGRCLQRS